MNLNTGIADMLKQLANPGKFTADLIAGAVAEIAKAVAAAMKLVGEKFDPIGLASRSFLATAPWEGHLSQDLGGGAITLRETS